MERDENFEQYLILLFNQVIERLAAIERRLPGPSDLTGSPSRGQNTMTDAELTDVLAGTLEAVKTQMIYVRNLHDAFSALHSAAMRLDPRLEQFDKEEIPKIRLNPVQQERIDAIDALLARLEKPRSH